MILWEILIFVLEAVEHGPSIGKRITSLKRWAIRCSKKSRFVSSRYESPPGDYDHIVCEMFLNFGSNEGVFFVPEYPEGHP